MQQNYWNSFKLLRRAYFDEDPDALLVVRNWKGEWVDTNEVDSVQSYATVGPTVTEKQTIVRTAKDPVLTNLIRGFKDMNSYATLLVRKAIKNGYEKGTMYGTADSLFVKELDVIFFLKVLREINKYGNAFTVTYDFLEYTKRLEVTVILNKSTEPERVRARALFSEFLLRPGGLHAKKAEKDSVNLAASARQKKPKQNQNEKSHFENHTLNQK